MADDATNPAPMLIAAEPQLFTVDLPQALDFYLRKLGFAVAFSHGEPPFYAQVFRGGARLNLRHVDEMPFDPIAREHDQVLSATLTIADAEPLFDEYQAAGVNFAQPLRSEPWGTRTFIIRDLDGNLLLVAGQGSG